MFYDDTDDDNDNEVFENEDDDNDDNVDRIVSAKSKTFVLWPSENVI